MSLSHSGTPCEHDVIRYNTASAADVLGSPHGIAIHRRGSAGAIAFVSERTPLLRPPPPIPRLHELADDDDIASAEQTPTAKIFWEELRILTLYSLPAVGYVLPSTFPPYSYLFCFPSTDLAEYSFIVASVICIGHISTLALAAATLGSMTATVSGYTIVHGFALTLETLLPPAWTSDRPHMVGLWTQRMGLLFFLHRSWHTILIRRLRQYSTQV